MSPTPERSIDLATVYAVIDLAKAHPYGFRLAQIFAAYQVTLRNLLSEDITFYTSPTRSLSGLSIMLKGMNAENREVLLRWIRVLASTGIDMSEITFSGVYEPFDEGLEGQQ